MKVPVAASPFNTDPTAVKGLGQLQTLIGYAAWAGIGVATIALLLVGARSAIAHRRGEAPGQGLFGVVVGAIIIGGASSIYTAIFGFSLFTSKPEAVPGLFELQSIISTVSWACVGASVLGLILAGAMATIAHHRGETIGERLGAVLVGCTLVSAAGTLIGALV